MKRPERAFGVPTPWDFVLTSEVTQLLLCARIELLMQLRDWDGARQVVMHLRDELRVAREALRDSDLSPIERLYAWRREALGMPR